MGLFAGVTAHLLSTKSAMNVNLVMQIALTAALAQLILSDMVDVMHVNMPLLVTTIRS